MLRDLERDALMRPVTAVADRMRAMRQHLAFALGTSLSWLAVAQRLADRFEFLLVDRRGRGASGHGAPPQTLGKEVDNARAVLSIAGPDASVIGHSFGGAVALELARQAQRGAIRRLVLYELERAGVVADHADGLQDVEELIVAAQVAERAGVRVAGHPLGWCGCAPPRVWAEHPPRPT